MEKNGRTVLLIGGSGSMGSYLSPLLLELGCRVTVASLEQETATRPGLRFLSGDFRDLENLDRLLADHYDAVIDFLNYSAEEYRRRCRRFLENTGHYIFLSSYRVYNGRELPTRETSPRFLDQCDDEDFRRSSDYSIEKARNEDFLRASGMRNWTIVRPSVVFSRLSLPLVSLGAWMFYNRALDGKPALIPDEALEIRGCATWAGDIARMFAGVLFNSACFGETYTFATGESPPWREWAEYYRELFGLRTWTVDLEAFKTIYWNNAPWATRQLLYDRMLNRVMDNSKILNATGLSPADLTPVFKGLELEIRRLPKGFRFSGPPEVNRNMDRFLAGGGRVIRKL